MDFDLQFGRSSDGRRGLQGPMRMLILGDLTGQGSRPDHPPGTGVPARKTLSVDVDNLEQMMARLAPRIGPEGGSPGGAAIEFRSLDDFHPDALYRRLAMFEPMRTLRARLLDPATAAAAVAELAPTEARGSEPDASHPTDSPPEAPPETTENDEKMIERLLGARPVNVARSAAGAATGQPRSVPPRHRRSTCRPGRQSRTSAAGAFGR
jgi:hypothetical protein